MMYNWLQFCTIYKCFVTILGIIGLLFHFMKDVYFISFTNVFMLNTMYKSVNIRYDVHMFSYKAGFAFFHDRYDVHFFMLCTMCTCFHFQDDAQMMNYIQMTLYKCVQSRRSFKINSLIFTVSFVISNITKYNTNKSIHNII